MVGAPARPRLVVLGVVRRRIGGGGAALQVLEHEARAPVRVLHRIDEDQRLAQHGVDVGVALRRQQVVGLEQRRVRGRDLVAMDAVRQPGDDRQIAHEPIGVSRRQRSRIGEALQVGLHLVQPPDAVGAANHHHPQRATLPGARVLEQPRPRRRRRGQRLQVDADLVRRGDLDAVVVAEHLLQRGNGRVVRRTRPDRLRRRLREDGRRQQHGERGGDTTKPSGYGADANRVHGNLPGSVRADRSVRRGVSVHHRSNGRRARRSVRYGLPLPRTARRWRWRRRR